MAHILREPIAKWRKNSAGCKVLAMLLTQGGLTRKELGKQLTQHVTHSPRTVHKNAYEVALGRYVKKGWVVEAEEAGQRFLKLTKAGELQALLACLYKGHSQRRTRRISRSATLWLATFDIPEIARRTRDFLRWFLLMIGFQKLQKSVYISAHPIPKEALRYLEHSGLRKYIRLMQVQEADNFEELLKMCQE